MVGGKRWKVHRLAFTLMVREIEPGEHVHHTCGNRACFNPAHLTALSHGDHTKLHRLNPWCHKCGEIRDLPREDGGFRCRSCYGEVRREATVRYREQNRARLVAYKRRWRDERRTNLCACGCGTPVGGTWARGHHRRAS